MGGDQVRPPSSDCENAILDCVWQDTRAVRPAEQQTISRLIAGQSSGTRTELGLLRSASRQLHAIHDGVASWRGER